MRLAPFALLLVAGAASAAGPTVAVLPFRDLSGGKASVGEAIRETVTSDLKQLGGVRVVERAQLDRVLGEQHLQAGGEVDAATAARVGKLLGATLIAVGAYQQSASDVRLTARFVQVETGEIVGTAKVDGRASEFLRLQDRVTAELLKSAGMAQHAKKMTERSRPQLKSFRTLELYGDAVVAESDEKKAELLKLAVAEDAAFSYAAADLAALEKRMKGYEALARAKQDEKTRALLDDFAKEKDPQKQATMAMQVINTLQLARKYRTMAALARSIMAGPAAASTLPMTQIRLDELCMFYVITAENALKQHDAVLHDGEEFLRRFSTSQYFNSVKMVMDGVIREKRQVEEGRAKVQKEVADLHSEQRWNLCRVATTYTFAHQYVEAQRLFRACFAVGGVDKHALPQLISVDLALGDWAAIKKDLAELEKADPDMYRTMKSSYEMAIPSDV
ncbi:MAG: putative adenylate cyclase [Myxococcales bacterium]|nr:putative adenylate cyclase [Myxococcales bacterium]